MTKSTKPILAAALSLFVTSALNAQSDLYISPTSNMYLHPNSNMAVFGNIINDAVGGLNHTNGGTLYLMRTSAQGTGNSQVLDGPLATAPTDVYNAGGAYIRAYNFVTDNQTGTAVPSGTAVNTESGSGQIEIRQEVRVTQNHNFVNGTVWTPRDDWGHAYMHYEDAATYTGVAAENTAGKHVDGYVAKTGSSNFTFPVGDGINVRNCAIVTPSAGTYKAAYFHKNAQNGTTGISGPSAGATPVTGFLERINTSEFWDIDGTASTKIALSAYNTGAYSNWAADFDNHPWMIPASNIIVTGWDGAWQDLGISTPYASTFSDDGSFTSSASASPDLGNTSNPYGAFTWALSSQNYNLAIDISSVTVSQKDCKVYVDWVTESKFDNVIAHIERKDDQQNFYEIAKMEISSEGGNKSFSYVDFNAPQDIELLYRIGMESDGEINYSQVRHIVLDCQEDGLWQLYPNPVTNNFTIDGVTKSNSVEVQVYSIVGQIVKTVKIDVINDKIHADIDIDEFSEGLYEVRVVDNNSQKNIFATKVMKK